MKAGGNRGMGMGWKQVLYYLKNIKTMSWMCVQSIVHAFVSSRVQEMGHTFKKRVACATPFFGLGLDDKQGPGVMWCWKCVLRHGSRVLIVRLRMMHCVWWAHAMSWWLRAIQYYVILYTPNLMRTQTNWGHPGNRKGGIKKTAEIATVMVGRGYFANWSHDTTYNTFSYTDWYCIKSLWTDSVGKLQLLIENY